ncbi:MAG TPA: MFS transporter [Candidatus Baltobacteraceae bacterium]|nr:MFS transporter [Candidatus Baltobacteraceae bacterium]
MPKPAHPARITLLWFGVQLIWGAVLGISLQARTVQLAAGSSLATFAEISASGAFAAGLTQLVVGPLSDHLRRRGRRRSGFYLLGAIFGSGAVLALYAAPTAGTLLASFVALQFSLNLIIGPYQAVIPDTLPPQRFGFASGWLAALGSAGNATGAVLAAFLGNGEILGIALALGLLSAALGTLLHLRGVPLQPLSERPPFALTRTLVDLFISRAMVYLGFYTVLGYLYFFVAAVLPRGFVLDATRASGLCILLFTALGTAGAMIAARPADRSDERLVVTAGGGLVCVSLVVLALAQALPVLPLAIAAAGVGWGIFLCADWAFACRLLPPNAMATTMAVWNLAVVGPQLLAPLVASLLLSRLGTLNSGAGPRDAMLLASAELLIGTGWIWRLPLTRTGK